MPPVDVRNAIDLHIHAMPSLLERMSDDAGFARMAAEAGMRGIAIKSHFEPTASRAYYAMRLVPGVRVYGGIVLNWNVGGINPVAVETQLKLGAKIVWMPTIHAAEHGRVYGLGSYGYQDPDLSVPVQPISVLEGGELTGDCVAVLELAKKYDVVVATSHLSSAEIFKLVEVAREIGCRKVVVTHPYFRPPNLTLEESKRLVRMGAILEMTAGNHCPIPGYGNLALDVETIQTVGADNCFISTDAGQWRKAPPPETLRTYVQCLYEKGISRRDIEVLIVENPAKLVDWRE